MFPWSSNIKFQNILKKKKRVDKGEKDEEQHDDLGHLRFYLAPKIEEEGESQATQANSGEGTAEASAEAEAEE